MSIEVMKQALEALDNLYLPGELERVNAALPVLRQAIAEAEQKTPLSKFVQSSADEKAEVMERVTDKAIEMQRQAVEQAERHSLQAKGAHPAPCARFCEANAFNIEIRNLRSQLKQAHGIGENT